MRLLKIKWLKRLLLSLIGIFLICVCASMILIRKMEQTGITFESVHVSYPLKIKLKKLKLDFPEDGFLLTLQNTEFDLEIRKLIQAKFSGKSFKADKLKITTYPTDTTTTFETDSSAFSYSIVPFIKFDHIAINDVDMSFFSDLDTTIIKSKQIQAFNFLFNDSIHANAIYYGPGVLDLKMHSDTNTVPVNQPFYLTEYIPHYSTSNFLIDDVDLKITNDGSPFKIDKINCVTSTSNTDHGLRVYPKTLSCILQDTINCNFNSDAFNLASVTGGKISVLLLRAPGIELNLKDLKTLEGDNGALHEFVISESKISPHLIELISGTSPIFKSTAGNISFNGKVRYLDDTLDLQNFNVVLNEGIKATLNGNFLFNTTSTTINFKVAPLILEADGINSAFSFQVPTELKNFKAIGDANIHGALSEPSFTINSQLNRIPLVLNGKISNDKFNHPILSLAIQSSSGDLNESFPDLNQDISYKTLSILTNVDLHSVSDLKNINATITADTIRYSDYAIAESNFNLILRDHFYSLYAASEKQNWEMKLITLDDPLHSEKINFDGRFSFTPPNLKNPDLNTGRSEGAFKAAMLTKKQFLSLNIDFDSLLFKPINDKSIFRSRPHLFFENEKNNYSIRIDMDSSRFLHMHFNDSLFNWLNKYDFRNVIPDIAIDAKLAVDSTFIKSFLDLKGSILINRFNFLSKSSKTTVSVNAPLIRFNDLHVDSSYFSYDQTADYKRSGLFIKNFNYKEILLNDVTNRNVTTDNDSINVYLASSSKKFNQHLDLNAIIRYNNENILFKLNPLEEVHLGSEVWEIKNNAGIKYDLKTKNISGSLGLKQNEQDVTLLTGEKGLSVLIDSLKTRPIISSLFNTSDYDAYLNATIFYNTTDGAYALNGSLFDLLIDSVKFGKAGFDANGMGENLKFNIKANSVAGQASIQGKNNGNQFIINAYLADLNLRQIDTSFKLSGSDYDLYGIINGEILASFGTKKEMKGNFTIDEGEIVVPNYGIDLFIDKQHLKFTDNSLILNSFTISTKNKSELKLDGKLNLLDNNSLNLKIKSNNFELLNSRNSSSLVKGNLKVNSDLTITGSGGNFSVSGNLTVPENGNIEYFYKGAVSLNSSNELVIFKDFSAEEKKDKRNLARKKIHLNYNVNVDIENTSIYVLLSKTNQEYARLFPSGSLKLQTGNGYLPNVYGKIESYEGKVYYQAPLIQDIELNVDIAKMSWNGAIDNPIINFKAHQIFRVTPNEMSNDLSNKTERVPVIVTTKINNKTFHDFELNFDIKSENTEIQNIINSLPPEAKETAAINMMLFGKLNNDADKSKSSLSGVVGKMNEISRRNIKNADLTFHVDNHSINNIDDGSADQIGYTFSKGFVHKRLKLSVGGDLSTSQNTQTQGTQNYLINNVQLKYLIKENPGIFIQLCRANTYKGPFEGQVDESSIGIGFSQEKKNLFKRSNSKK